jgi:hypothetical protein
MTRFRNSSGSWNYQEGALRLPNSIPVIALEKKNIRKWLNLVKGITINMSSPKNICNSMTV